MPQSDDQVRAQLGAVEQELEKYPEDTASVAARVYDIMLVGSNADESKASFTLGQIFEVLLPMRTRARLLTKRKDLLRRLNEIAANQTDE